LGYGEVGCFGQKKIKTPAIDQLAAEGMKLMQHYSGAPVCAPSRCVLLTGKNLAHAEIRNNKSARRKRNPSKGIFPGQWPISAKAVTIAEVLKDAGYATGAFGKWGLGPSDSTGAPNRQGFDRFYGYICQENAHSYYPPYLDSDGKQVQINDPWIFGHQRKPKGEVRAEDYRAQNYAPDLILAEALKFIDENKNKPFFLYLPFVEPHVALQTPQKWIDKYPKEWDTKPYRNVSGYGYTPHPRPRAAYAGLISHLDDHVRRVMERLKQYGLDKNTIVIFTSDNGPTFNNIGGVDTKFFNSTEGYRGKKGSAYEGGIRVPCIIRWSGKVPPRSTSNVATYFPDWFPTICKLTGAKLPPNLRDGIDLTPLFTQKGSLPKRTEQMIWEFQGHGGVTAIRVGKWKALKRGNKNWELYNIETDRFEKHDVAHQFPEVVQRLETIWKKTRTSTRYTEEKL
jgi:arylsulfatase A-like enzyme